MNPYTPEQMLNALIEIASVSPEQKICIEFPYSVDPNHHQSLTITTSGRIVYFQENRTYEDCFGNYRLKETPLTADHALVFMKGYESTVYLFITDQEHTIAAQDSVMYHGEYAHLEKMINDHLDASAEIIAEVKFGGKSPAYLSNVNHRIDAIKSTLQIHRVKEDQA
ncbi:hypothetical protein [Nitrincola sp.]|uniref:hypothetical protein n=1 Tax=Nitrincola sp. TaxID=1926584 RepID=UPI003A901026